MRNYKGNRRDSGKDLVTRLEYPLPNSKQPIRLDRILIKKFDLMMAFAKQAEPGTSDYSIAKESADQFKALLDEGKPLHPKIVEKIMEMHRIFYEQGGTPPKDYPFCRRDPCPYWFGYCRKDPACND